jgi:hypothetical protein
MREHSITYKQERASALLQGGTVEHDRAVC